MTKAGTLWSLWTHVGTSLARGLLALVRHHQRVLVALYVNAVLCCAFTSMGSRSTKDPGQEPFSFKIGLGQVWDPGCSLHQCMQCNLHGACTELGSYCSRRTWALLPESLPFVADCLTVLDALLGLLCPSGTCRL
jgi:hypothetical protein